MKSLGLSLLMLALTGVASAASPRTGFYNNADGSPIAGLIAGARESVEMEIYEMDDPTVIDALREAKGRGVKIHIVQESKPVGASCHVFEASVDTGQPHHASGAVSCEGQRAFVKEINAGGGSYVPFQREVLCPGGKSCFEHGKIAVVDRKFALITTGNFNVSNLCDAAASPESCDRDFSYVSNDRDVVDGLSRILEADFAGERFAMSPAAQRKLTVSPNSLDSLTAFLDSAQESIQLENQYLKEPGLNAVLERAAKRGVKVSVMVASACSFGHPKPSEVKTLTAIFEGFDAAGISTRMFTRNMLVNGHAGYLHAKAIVVDGNHAWLGSINGSAESFFHNREFGIYFDSAEDVAGLASVLSADFSDSRGESWSEGLDCAEDAHK